MEEPQKPAEQEPKKMPLKGANTGGIGSQIPNQADLIGVDVGGVLQPLAGTSVGGSFAANVNIVGGGGGGGGAVTIADGADVTQGAEADTAVTGDNPGTVSAKLRGLNKIFASVWDAVNNLFAINVKQVGGTATDTNSGVKSAGTQRVVLATDQPSLTNAQPANITKVGGTNIALGQTTSSASLPVVLASDQPAVSVTRKDVSSTGNTLNAATANIAYTVNLNNGEGVVGFAVSGLTDSGATLAIEGSNDGGTTWSAFNAVAAATGLVFSTLTADQQLRVNASGRTNVRLRVSSTGTGTITISSNASSVSAEIVVGSPLPAGSNTVGNVVSRWQGLSGSTSLFDDVGVNPSIKNLANGAEQLSNAIDNTGNLAQFLDLDFRCTGASAFTAGGTVSVWLLPSLDGTNYEDGSSSVVPARAPDAYFFLRAVSTAQVLELTTLAIPPTKFKVLIQNNGGVAFDNTNGHNTLTAYTHS